jgi:hypothetical protein
LVCIALSSTERGVSGGNVTGFSIIPPDGGERKGVMKGQFVFEVVKDKLWRRCSEW